MQSNRIGDLAAVTIPKQCSLTLSIVRRGLVRPLYQMSDGDPKSRTHVPAQMLIVSL